MKPYKKRNRTPDEDRLVRLLDFIGKDLAALTEGERLGLSLDLWRDLQFDDTEASLAKVFSLIVPMEDAFVDLQTMLRAGIATLEAGRPWQPFDTQLAPMFVVVDKAVTRSYVGSPESIMLAAAVDLLVTFWPRIARCELKSCNRLFLREDGRQRFHDPGCANVARAEQLPEKKKPRNYVQEVANAARRELKEKMKKKANKKEKR